jgi:hypothetical protein
MQAGQTAGLLGALDREVFANTRECLAWQCPSQGGDTIFVKPLAIKYPQRLQLPPDITSALKPSL